jgi:hypothetical protein
MNCFGKKIRLATSAAVASYAALFFAALAIDTNATDVDDRAVVEPGADCGACEATGRVYRADDLAGAA